MDDFELGIISMLHNTAISEEGAIIRAKEHDIIEKIQQHTNEMDFSKINLSENLVFTQGESMIRNAAFLKYYILLEFLLKKYNEMNVDTLTKRNIIKGRNESYIFGILISRIFANDFDAVELLLKYVTDINEIGDNGMTYLSAAKYHSNHRHLYADIIELLEIHGAL